MQEVLLAHKMKKPLNFILRTYSNNPEFSGECDYALVQLGLPDSADKKQNEVC